MPKTTITIFGTSKAKSGDALYEQAAELGSMLAKAGFAIANGGYGGTMEAAAKGAAQNGGKVYGVICSAFKKARPNEFVSEEIKTGSLQERLAKLIEIGDAYIVLQGGTGTLLELAEVWELKNKHFISNEKLILLLGDFWQPLVELMSIDDAKCGQCLKLAKNVIDVLDILSGKFGEQINA